MSAGAGIGLDLSGVGVVASGLDEATSRRLSTRLHAYLSNTVGDPMLSVGVRYEGDAPVGAGFGAKRMRAEFSDGGAEFSMPEGRVSVDRDGAATMTLAPTDPEIRLFSFLNLVLASLAFLGPSRGIVVVHAAGVILDGRAFLMPGAEGAGKSTFAAWCAQEGAAVLSDDVILLDASDERPEALASPFREDPERPTSPGRTPVAAILFPVHGSPPALLEVPGLEIRARLVANLPFVNERYGSDPALDRIVERLATGGLARALRFAPDPGFVPLLRDLARARG